MNIRFLKKGSQDGFQFEIPETIIGVERISVYGLEKLKELMTELHAMNFNIDDYIASFMDDNGKIINLEKVNQHLRTSTPEIGEHNTSA